MVRVWVRPNVSLPPPNQKTDCNIMRCFIIKEHFKELSFIVTVSKLHCTSRFYKVFFHKHEKQIIYLSFFFFVNDTALDTG